MRIKSERNHIYSNGTVIKERPNIMTQVFAPLIPKSDPSKIDYSTLKFGRLRGLSVPSSPATMKRRATTVSVVPEKDVDVDENLFGNIQHLRPTSLHKRVDLDENNNVGFHSKVEMLENSLNHKLPNPMTTVILLGDENCPQSVQKNETVVNDFHSRWRENYHIFDVKLVKNYDESSFGIILICQNDNRVIVIKNLFLLH